MKCVLLLLPCVLALDASLSPVSKVVQMLGAMSEKGKAELQEEKVQHARYAQWCESTSKEKTTAIQAAADKAEVLAADISKAQTDAEVLAKEIEEGSAEVEKLSSEQAKAIQVREEEAGTYAAELKDYTESVSAIGRALETLGKQDYSRPQAEALLQLASSLSASKAEQVRALAEKPKVAGYEFQSSNVTNMLKDLQTKFVEEKRALEKAEMSRVQSHALLLASLKSQETAESEGVQRKAGLKSKKQALKASKEDELATTVSSKDADTKYLDDVSSTCRQKAADFESNQKLRTEELQAVEQAVQIVSKKLSLLEVKWRSLLQVKHQATSLALLRSVRNDEQVKARLLGFLQQEAERLHSAALTNLLEPAATGALEMIKQTIQGVVQRLQEQADADTEKQTWCASELKANEKNRRAKTVLVDGLNADIDRLNASIISFGEDIVSIQKELAETAQALANATEIRGKEKQTNAATIKEAQEAQAAVLEAVTVLKEFYEKSGLALLQESAKAAQPESVSIYGGMTDQSGGVVALLETIAADFARLEADTSSEEQSAGEEFEKFSKDYRQNKAEKEKDLKHLQENKVEHTAELSSKGSELQTGEQELAAALQYYEELKPPCVKGGAAWEEREKQRQEEIESLQKAMEILATS
ncbi:unnamed protein product [Effrenium voratum]|nr:unnamed protein product [Effrenium voratum]|mmetsp:Transcript_15476/g.36599  ORF Transcript_15476/g.36599 Transcript_15476/m.36599 type:complete len:647 (+) Transcript_15476:71-2011(+)